MLLLGVSSLLAVAFAAPTCEPTCTQGSTVYQFDYRQLTIPPPPAVGGRLYSGADGVFNYTMNICANAFDTQNANCNGMVCQYSVPTQDSPAEFEANIAYWDGMPPDGDWEPIDPNDCQKGMALRLTNGEMCSVNGVTMQRQLLIEYMCEVGGQELPTELVAVEDEACRYQIQISAQALCDTSMKCQSAPCLNNGQCTLDSGDPKGFVCTCPTGGQWIGETCEVENPCYTSPCYNGGVCTAVGGQSSCKCLAGYTGSDCSARATAPCSKTSSWKGWGVFCLVALIFGVLYLAFQRLKGGARAGTSYEGGYQQDI